MVPLHSNSRKKHRNALQELVIFFVFFSGSLYFSTAQSYFDVLDFGAVGDGLTNDTQAFHEAWTEACISPLNPVLVIPGYKTFLVHPIVFNGPCQSTSITVMVVGTVIAPDSPVAWEGKDPGKWLKFNDVNGLSVTGLGYGALSGRGLAWWNQSCRDHPKLKGCTSLAPTTITFSRCNSSSFRDIVSVNSSQTHLLIINSSAVRVSNVMMQAPERSPNTDGIHISSSHDVCITNSVFATGDDCVSIGDYTSNVVITNVVCGPGHGISIGSVGRRGNFAQVENIHVSRSYLKGTTNGLRIKTWQAGRGYVRNVLFEDITFESVENPIIIDQNYCSKRGLCEELPSGVHISNVTYKEMKGSSSSDTAIKLECDSSVPCTGLNLSQIYLRPAPTDIHGTSKIAFVVTAACANAHGLASLVDPPVSCLEI